MRSAGPLASRFTERSSWAGVLRMVSVEGRGDWTYDHRLTSQRGVVGADLASILAKRTAKPEVRAAARQAAISKAKSEKRDKEAKKSATKPAGSANAPKVSKQSMKGGAGKGGR